jgi:hypothetical protein
VIASENFNIRGQPGTISLMKHASGQVREKTQNGECFIPYCDIMGQILSDVAKI